MEDNFYNGYEYTGTYSQKGKDETEKIYSYCFELSDMDGNLIDTSGVQIHDSSKDSESASEAQDVWKSSVELIKDINEEKIEKVQKYNAAMLEIDLSSYFDDPVSRDELRDIIINKENDKHWIHYPLSDNAIKKAQHHYKNLNIVKTYLQNIAKKEAREEKIKLLFEPSNYANTLKKFRNDDEFLKKCAKIHKPYYFDFCKYFKIHRSVPFFIDIPITGEMIFQCDRRIWQSIIFNRFIYGRKQDGASLNITNLFDVLKDEYHIPVDYDLTYKLPHPLDNDEIIWLRREVIEQYTEYLEIIGFITTSYNFHNKNAWATVEVKKSIKPPDKSAADKLQKVLQSVNLLSPDINRLIATAFDEN